MHHQYMLFIYLYIYFFYRTLYIFFFTELFPFFLQNYFQNSLCLFFTELFPFFLQNYFHFFTELFPSLPLSIPAALTFANRFLILYNILPTGFCSWIEIGDICLSIFLQAPCIRIIHWEEAYKDQNYSLLDLIIIFQKVQAWVKLCQLL
jgi:hypothetical protein